MKSRIKILDNGNELVLFNILTLEILILAGNEKIKELIENCDIEELKKYSQNPAIKRVVDFYNENISEEQLKYNRTEKSIYEISFPTVHKCNLACKYCFANSGNNVQYNDSISYFTIKKAMDYLVNDFGKDATKYKVSFVSGGEPFLDLAQLKNSFDIINELASSINKQIEVFLCTNGTMYDDEIEQFLIRYSPALGISIDGNESMHNSARIFKDGSGSYKKVKDTIIKIRDNRDISKKTKEIWALTVLHKNNMSILDIISSHKTLNIKHAQIKLARLNGQSELKFSYDDLATIKKQYNELVDQLLREAANNDYSTISMILNNIDYFGKIIRLLLLKIRVLYRCNAARSKFAVTAMGEIYPCDSFVGNEDFRLGSLDEGIDQNIVEKFRFMTVFNREKCSVCWARFVCGGDCYYNSYINNKDISIPDDLFCDIQRCLVELSLSYLAKLRLHCKPYYNNLLKNISTHSKLNGLIIG